MKQKRILGHSEAIYHCMSRVVDRRFIFGDTEKQWFIDNMRRIEAFTGCRVLSYCLMSNHFHVLVQVPDARSTYISDDEVLERIENFYGKARREVVEEELVRAVRQKRSARAKGAILDRYRARMNNLAEFMKRLKQRFSFWYNKRNERRGTLWEACYKSVLVQGGGEPLLTMTAYIELNPVRGGICEDPLGYRWCSFGAAFGGDEAARGGIVKLFEILGHPESVWRSLSGRYRKLVVGAGGGRGVAEGIADSERVGRETPEAWDSAGTD